MSITKDDSFTHEKGAHHDVHNIEDAAIAGHVATDIHGRPLVSIDEMAERKLRRKLDIRLIPTIALLYLFCFIDRANIGNARLAGLERDLKLVGYDYNLLLTAFYVAYVVFEPPMNFLCKYTGPGRFIPILCFAFGLFSFVMAYVRNFAAAFAVRFLLGVAEAGVFPGMAYYLSRFYRKDELSFRLAMYIVCAPLAGAFGGLLASGILKLNGFGIVREWRLIFFIEGLITMGISVAAWFFLPDRPETARWLSAEEKALCEVRLKSENAGMLKSLDHVHGSVVRRGMFNPVTLTVGFIFLLDNIAVQGLGFFLPSIIRTIYPRETTIQQQLRTVPPYIVGAFTSLVIPYMAFKTKKCAMWMLVSAPFMTAGYSMFLATPDSMGKNGTIRYAATFLITMGAFSFGALCNSWGMRNATSDTGRASALATIVFMGNLGGLVSTWTFLTKLAPNQVPGNGLNTAGSVTIILLSAAMWLWMIKQNKNKEMGRDDHLIEGKSPEEQEMLGTRHPGFRYLY